MTRRIRFTPLARAGVFAAGLVLAAAGVRASDVPFSTPPPISTTADAARGLFSADLDGDGDLDVLSASTNDDKIAWYENVAGNGSIWATHTISLTADGAWWAYAADVDGDGDPDVLSASTNDDKIAWYENLAGNGSTWTLHTISLTADAASSVFAADIDGDGDLDVLSASYNDDKVAWYENVAGNGSTWTLHTISLTADFAVSAFAADVDRDGDLDVLSASINDNKVAWYENVAGDGSVWTLHTISLAANGPNSVFAADVDGDGDVDALSSSENDDKIAWYENVAGDGSVWSLHTVSVAANFAVLARAADVDGDGDLDILSASILDDKIAWYENAAGNGSSWTPHTISVTANGAFGVLAADVDGDGDEDVVSTSFFDDKVAWYRNDTIHSSACFPVQAPIATGADGAHSVFAVDLDSDGDADIVSASLAGNTIAWHQNSGDGSAWTTHTISTVPAGPYSVFAADVDGDGDVDVLSVSYLDRVNWHENVSGSGSTWATHTITTAPNAPAAVFAADVDGDGDLDALSASIVDDTVAWYENVAGNGSAWTAHTVTTGADGAQSAFAADVDGDGDIDVLSASYVDNTIAWYENSAGNGTAWIPHIISTTAQFAVSVFAADVDGDGDQDALSASPNDGKVAWYENVAGNGSTWTTHTITTAALGPFSAYAADLDGDGDVDAVSASVNGGLEWYENTAGDGSVWATHTLAGGANGATSVLAADVDGDGRDDILSAQYFDDTVAWNGNGGGQFSLAASDTAPSGAINGELVPMLSVIATHAGRAGDGDLELAGMGLLFEEAPGDPLTSAEANAVIESLRIYRDANGNGVFDPASDVLVVTIPTLALTNGIQAVTFADGDPNVQVSFGTPRTYFVVTELTANASQQTPNQFRVTHLGLGPSASTAEDRTYDIALRPACPADASSSILGPITPVELLGFTVE